jgi:hypothetical protein
MTRYDRRTLIRTLKPAGIHRSWPEPSNNRTQPEPAGRLPRFRYALPTSLRVTLKVTLSRHSVAESEHDFGAKAGGC